MKKPILITIEHRPIGEGDPAPYQAYLTTDDGQQIFGWGKTPARCLRALANYWVQKDEGTLPDVD